MIKTLRKFGLLTILFLSVFSCVHADTTLDSATITGPLTLSFNFFGGTAGTDPQYYELSYIPGASHNLCSVTFPLAFVNSTTTDGVQLNLYSGPVATASTTSFMNSSVNLQQQADSAFQITQKYNNSTYQNTTYTFSPCAVVAGGFQYFLVLSRTGTASSTSLYFVKNQSGSSGSNPTITTTGTGTYGYGIVANNGSVTFKNLFNTNVAMQFSMGGTENFAAVAPSNATSSTSITNTQCFNGGNLITDSLCYLFIPSQSVLNQYSNLTTLLNTKIPFSYVANVITEVNTITSDATSSMPLINIDLHDYASSTITGTIPDLSLSTSTISHYLNSTFLSLLQDLITAGIWIGVAFLFYAEGLKIFSSNK